MEKEQIGFLEEHEIKIENIKFLTALRGTNANASVTFSIPMIHLTNVVMEIYDIPINSTIKDLQDYILTTIVKKFFVGDSEVMAQSYRSESVMERLDIFNLDIHVEVPMHIQGSPEYIKQIASDKIHEQIMKHLNKL